MFFKRLKEKSNQKYINSLLSSQRPLVHAKKIDRVGVILNLSEFDNYDALRQLLKSIGVKDNRVSFIGFIEDEKEVPNSWDSFFYAKDFGWKGKVENVNFKEFTNQPFDALISYYKEDKYELKLATALSKANFKIGLTTYDERLNDFIIDVQPKELDVFKTELIKYLKVLNKI
jgi:hypothetical protein